MPSTLDVQALEAKVKDMYRLVAQEPTGHFHFELGRELALRLGYDATRLAAVPAQAVDSFAGVGHFFDLADLKPGENVVDLGSGSGSPRRRRRARSTRRSVMRSMQWV